MDARTPNPERGEVALVLDGACYPMRPTYQAMVEIEQRLGPLVGLSTRLLQNDKRLSVQEFAIVAEVCIRAAGEDRNDPMLKGVTAGVLAQKIFDEGVLECVPAFVDLLFNMLTGGTKRKKKAADQATDQSTTPTPE